MDLIVHGDLTAAAEQLRQALPPGVEVTTPGAQAKYMAGLVGAYRLNLSVLSAIALFVGMFLIYQSVTLSVVRRRREIGLLRTLGMTRGQVMLLFLLEGALSGALGGLLGLVLGAALAQAALGMVAQNLTSSVSAGAGRRDLVGGPGLSPGLGSGRGRHPAGLLGPGPGGFPDQGQGGLV